MMSSLSFRVPPRRSFYINIVTDRRSELLSPAVVQKGGNSSPSDDEGGDLEEAKEQRTPTPEVAKVPAMFLMLIYLIPSE